MHGEQWGRRGNWGDREGCLDPGKEWGFPPGWWPMLERPMTVKWIEKSPPPLSPHVDASNGISSTAEHLEALAQSTSGVGMNRVKVRSQTGQGLMRALGC